MTTGKRRSSGVGRGGALAGKVAVIAGASKGIGAAIAESLAEEGCRLALAARSTELLEKAADQLRRDFGAEVLTVPTDVSEEGQARALIEKTESHFGAVDILVNNAGMGIYGAVDELDLGDLRHVFEVNFFGALAALQAAVPVMRRQGGGTVVNISSIVGKFPQPLGGGYTATKFALQGASGAARREGNWQRFADLRYTGQSFELTIPFEESKPAVMRKAFEREHERTYGHKAPDDPVELVNLRVEVTLPREGAHRWGSTAVAKGELEGPRERAAYFGAAIGQRTVPLLARHELATSDRPGPLIVEEYDTTILVPPNCTARRDAWDNVVITVGEERT